MGTFHELWSIARFSAYSTIMTTINHSKNNDHNNCIESSVTNFDLHDLG